MLADAVFDRRSANLVGLGGFWIDDRSSDHQVGFARLHDEQVGLLFVVFGLPAAFAMNNHQVVIAVVGKRCRANLLGIDFQRELLVVTF